MISLRIATPADEETVLEMMRGLRAEDPMPASSWEASVGALRVLLNEGTPAGKVYLLEREGNVLGYGVLIATFSLELGGRICFLDELFVRRENRGKGAGGEALKLLLKEARSLGFQAIHLEVSAGNRAEGLYRRNGFVDREYRLLTHYLGK